ncbi:hypothetical protein ACJMK2_035359 [Sinanodonta woodiana]|uniref:Kinesin-like protein n=1 Tax=Sinanodonta woodiana TaxID=1069815 RepID=A0ABD3WYL6_SINWO
MTEIKSKIGGGEQNLTVVLRIRPMNEDEVLLRATQISHKVGENMVVLMDPLEDPDDILRANRSREKTFVFDQTFDGNATQEKVYDATTKFLIENVVTGYNATVFAYGATGAGKTYTMLGTDNEPGIMARALNDLFLQMEKSDDMAYKVTMSYLEIYNEMIRDLLNPGSGILDLREDSKGGVQVAGLVELKARSTEEVMRLLMQGNKERTQEPTAANKTSSRSHAVLQVIVRQQNKARNIMQEVRTGKLFLVDLAGSERAANTHNRGKRMVEGAHINRSLLALGNCINALTDKNGKGYVNYRDSKLTRLLKDALGGNCKTVMIAHISPASIHFEESRNTLIYADRAKHIKTKVRRNVTDVAYHIAQYTNIIQELREEILRLRHKLQDQPSQRRVETSANIQQVHSEVLEARRSADTEELHKLKEQLLISFKDQMELRKSLMELNNASMEISLETNRNQMTVSDFEVERARAGKMENPDRSIESLMKENEKALEMSGAGTDELNEPEDVKVAREELKVLNEEKYRTEKVRSTVRKELEMAKEKTRKLEEQIPHRISTDEQREVLRLLCKVHELEIKKTEVQSMCLLRNFQIKKKDMVISRFKQHQSLCDKIIHTQKVLLEDKNIYPTQELEELYDLYKLELKLQREDTDGFVSELNTKGDIDQQSVLTEETEPLARMRLRSNNPEDKIFEKSPRSLRMKDQRSLSGVWRNDSNLSIEDDNLSNNSPRKSPGFLGPSRVSTEDRTIIATNTRNIAALAAKKRSKAQGSEGYNFDKVLPGELKPSTRKGSDKSNEDYNYLTPSRLDKHNSIFVADQLAYSPLIKLPSDDNLSTVTKQTAYTEPSLPPLRKTGDGERYRDGRQWEQEKGKRSRRGENSYAQQFAKHSRRGRSVPKMTDDVYKTGRTGNNDRVFYKRNAFLRPDDTEFPTTPSEKSKNGGKKKGYRNNTAFSDSSVVSTPQNKKRNKKLPPTIPAYRKGDITVTGFSLPRY